MKEKNTLETILIVFLMVTTVSLFSYWGYQSVIYILGEMFNVQTESTIFSVIIGILGMISGALVFAGVSLWSTGRLSARNFITYGSVGFMIKNIFDLFNSIAIFRITHPSNVNIYQIQQLAGKLGSDLFQFAFWVFVIAFFAYLAKKRIMSMPQVSQNNIG